MDGIFEHVVQEVGVWFYVVIERLQILDFSALLLVEQIEIYFEWVQFLIFDLISEVGFLFPNFSIAFFKLFLLIVQGSNFFVDLLFHHLVEVLLLNIELLHDAAEGFLKAVNLFIELFAHFHLQLIVKILRGRSLLFQSFDFAQKFLNHMFHAQNYINEKVMNLRCVLLLGEQFTTSCFWEVCLRMHLLQNISESFLQKNLIFFCVWVGQ